MIKKLKIKFILTNVLLIVLVLAAVLVSVYFSTTAKYRNESLEAMKAVADGAEKDEKTKKDALFDKGGYSYFNTFYIVLQTNGKLLGIYGQSGTVNTERKEYMQKVADTLLSIDAGNGIIENEQLRYYIKKTPREIRIVFLDMTDETEAVSSLLKLIATVGLFGIGFALLISYIIAKISIAPVERSIEQQKRLVSDASHELKTPLTIIKANTDVLLQNPDGIIKENDKWLHYINSEAEQMTTLVNNMLFLAKTDEDKTYGMSGFSMIDLSQTLVGCILPFETVCFESGRTLDWDVKPDVKINGDESKIKQLITCLVDNACKYSDKGGKIFVSLDTEKDNAVIKVKNTGNPIPKEDLEHIFERFYRVDKSRTKSEDEEKRTGYGLGLSISKVIAESHNGKITAESDDTDGTVFTVKIPLAK